MRLTNFLKRYLLLSVLILISFIIFPEEIISQNRVRTEVNIPDIPGYVTLKCDFHIHTVFSDGSVWPHIRPEEAWREGLDALSITDHIEYQPHKEDVKTNHNRSFELAKSSAEALNIILVRGAEITRTMPPGHLNAIFLTDADKLDVEDYQDAIENAANQRAFIFWNHPGWTGQQPDGKARWYDEHTELHQRGWLHGIEVVNGGSYYPEAHQWCLDKKLTMIGTSDIHSPIQMDYNFEKDDHRPMTLVFAKARTATALKDALLERQTAVYWKDKLIGEAKFLEPMFAASIEIINPEIKITGKGSVNVQIHNHSDVPFQLTSSQDLIEIYVPNEIILAAKKTVLLPLQAKSENLSGNIEFSLPFVVKNLWIEPDTGLPIQLDLKIEFN